MSVMKIRELTDKNAWDQLVKSQDGHPLQLWGWGELKSGHNWQARRLVVMDGDKEIGGAQVLQRRLPKPFGSLSYTPRGPFGKLTQSTDGMKLLADYVRQANGGTHLTAEPDLLAVKWGRGWKKTANTILLPRTLILDLDRSDENLLADMTKKTRQYIRKSERSGVEVRTIDGSTELQQVMELYHDTATRAGFALHNDAYYEDCAKLMGDDNVIFGAFHSEKLVSFVWLAVSQATAFELYGGMNETGQQLRANYTLKWQAIRAMREQGITRYDMNGLLNDGISSFKQGFSNHETMLAGSYDYAFSNWYTVWNRILPFGKKVIRFIKSLRK